MKESTIITSLFVIFQVIIMTMEHGVDKMTEIEKKFYDSLVEGYNLAWIKQQYSLAQSHPGEYVLIHMNLKNFRYFNCLYGIEGGNDILKTIYHTLSAYLKPNEFIAHDTSDNFLLLLHYTDINDFLFSRMTEIIELCYRIDDPRLYRNNFESFGIFQLNHHTCSFEEAYNLANICRKQSNTIANRSHCYELYEDSFKCKLIDSCDLETKTANAFFNYQFVPYLQPKVDPKTNKIVGAESLMRWIDEAGKMIPVSDFLHILIENSYIYVVDLDLFDLVCNQLDERIRGNLPVVPISFNLSSPEFYHTNFVDDYLKVFNKYDIPSELIEFELMESISFDDTCRVKAIIDRLHNVGFKCSLDDFGSGFASFNVLLNTQIDTVKMDRQFFIQNLNGDNKCIIKTIIDLVKSMHMYIVAEGVETLDYVEFLKDCDCDAIQGYYYYKPMPTLDFFALLDTSDNN